MQDSMIPVYTTSLVGRAQEAHEILELLQNPSIRLMSLTGTSGTGKTRLSLEVIRAWEEREDAKPIIFVPLAAISNPELVLPTLARVLNIREHSSIALLEQIVAHVEEHPMIMILDNFEQVLAAKTEIAQLIQKTTDLQLLITSQEALNLDIETHYTIPGLSTPATPPDTVAEALEYAAIQLFVERIQTIQPTFTLNQANLDSVVKICTMLEGLPLAIEIVATHSDVLAPDDMKLLVNQHLRLYQMRSKATTGRQRIIIPIIEWSLLRLPKSAQDVFNHLGVFQGGWEFEALAAVIPTPTYNLRTALDLLAKRHLILQQAGSDQTVRYMMLDAVQDYANSRFKKLEYVERVESIKRHLHFMAELTTEASKEIEADQRLRYWSPRLTQETPNIRLLLDWGIEHKPQAAMSVIQNLGRFWAIASYWKEGLAWSTKLLKAYQPEPDSRALLLYRQALYLYFLGQNQDSMQVATEGLAYAKEAQNDETQRMLYNVLGIYYVSIGNLPQAREHYQASLEIAQTSNDIKGRLVALGNIAAIDFEEEKYDLAFESFQDIYNTEQQLGYHSRSAMTLVSIVICYIMRREYEPCLAELATVLEIADSSGHKELHALALHLKGEVLIATKQAGAAATLQASIEEFNTIGSIKSVYGAFETYVALLVQQNQIHDAGLIWGATAALREAKTMPPDKNFLPMTQDALVQSADLPEFQEAVQQGRTWEHDQLVQFSLDTLSTLEAAAY